MSNFSSTIQVLKVDDPEKIKLRDGTEFIAYGAQCALLTDSGDVHKVGKLRIPEHMVGKVQVGLFRAAFGLEVAQWGKNKGEIIAALTDLQSAPVRKASPSAAA